MVGTSNESVPDMAIDKQGEICNAGRVAGGDLEIMANGNGTLIVGGSTEERTT